MFRFVKRMFVSAMMLFGCSLSSVNPLECVLINNQECKVRPEIVNVNSNDKLVEECTENIGETRLVEKTSAKNKNKHECSSCKLYIVLFLMAFKINVGIGIYFTYFYWYLKKEIPCVEFNTRI